MTNPLKIKFFSLLLTLWLWTGVLLFGQPPSSEEINRVLPQAPQTPKGFQNTNWPKEAEEAMLDRFWVLVAQAVERNASLRKIGEQKAQAYPDVLLRIFSPPHKKAALESLQGPEVDGRSHQWTEGIDYYWSTILPFQIRKYFYFGEWLTPEYRQRMYTGARRWTEEDPRPGFDLINQMKAPCAMSASYAREILEHMSSQWSSHFTPPSPPSAKESLLNWENWWIPILAKGWQVYEEKERLLNPFPHPTFGHGSGPVGREWSPAARGMRVDPRNTHNLRTMRDTSIYLMAEETGNERVRKLYREKIREQVALLYRVGYGEWDSDYYLASIFAAYHNLYDFARDEEVIALAKAALDWHYASAALKYRRGVFGGPAKRATNRELGNYLAFVFGNYPAEKEMIYSPMALFPATSAYRPPAAVLALARQEFPPTEILSTKPNYSPHLPGQADNPESFETLYIGSTFTLGTINSRHFSRSTRRWHLSIDDPERGAVSFLVNSGNHPARTLRPCDQIAQVGANLIWLRPNDGRSLSFAIPAGARGRLHNDRWFLEINETWIALKPIGLNKDGIRPFLQHENGEDFTLRQVPTGDTAFIGFAMEIGTPATHGSLSRFITNISQVQEVELANLSEGIVRMVSSKGITLRLEHREGDLPFIEKHGEVVDWENSQLWQSYGNIGPISLDRHSGKLSVQAGGHLFERRFPFNTEKGSDD